MKKVLIVLAIIVGIVLFINRETINALIYTMPNQEAKYEKILTTGSPDEAIKTAEKLLKVKVKGANIYYATSLYHDMAAQNPNPEVLKAVLDNEVIMQEIKKEIDAKNYSIDWVMFDYIPYGENAPEKVKILLEHGYNPYKLNKLKSGNISVMDSLQKHYDKIDPKVFYVIKEYYGYH